MQALDPAPQQPQRELVVRAQCLLGRGDSDERVAVAVSADPAAEAQEARLDVGAGVVLRQGALEQPGDLRREVVECRLEVVEAVPDLVHHLGAIGARLLRLPERDELLAQRRVGSALLHGRGLSAVGRPQHVGEARELGQDRPALGLGRVGGEDRLDQQPVEQRLQLGGRDPRLAQVRTAASIVSGAGPPAAWASRSRRRSTRTRSRSSARFTSLK